VLGNAFLIGRSVPMKKLVVMAAAAVLAALSFSTVAEARGPGYWHHGWNGHNHGWNNHYAWHGYHHRYYGGWYPYWSWPNVVIAPAYDDYDPYYDDGGYYAEDDIPACYIQRVRHRDRNGHVYIRRVRVCD
jgi:hypothetical protein